MKFRRRVTLSDTVKNQQHTDVAEVMGTHEITFKKPVGEKIRNKKWIPRRTSAGKESRKLRIVGEMKENHKGRKVLKAKGRHSIRNI